jgi:hypothetical protein
VAVAAASTYHIPVQRLTEQHSIYLLLASRRHWAIQFRLAQRPPCQGVQRKDMPPIAPRRRPFRPHFTCLYRLVLTRFRWPEVGPEALSRPATAQNSLGRWGRSPPCAPPCAAARRPAGLRPAEKLRLRRKTEGCYSSRRTALKTQQEVLCPSPNSLPLCVVYPGRYRTDKPVAKNAIKPKNGLRPKNRCLLGTWAFLSKRR